MANCTLLKCFILLDIALLLSELNSYGSTLKKILLILTKFQINFMHFDHLFVSKQIAIAHRQVKGKEICASHSTRDSARELYNIRNLPPE